MTAGEDRLPVVLVSDPLDRWDELVPGLGSRFEVTVVENPDEIGGIGLGRFAVVAEGRAAAVVLGRALDGDPIDAMVLLTPADDGSLAARESELAALTCPVLIFTGEDDPVVPAANVEALGDRIPSSTLGVLPGCGHDLVREAPETLFPMIVEYLRARYARAPHGHEDLSGLVMLQLERRPPWLDEHDEPDEEPAEPDPATQEVGPGA
jgi:pimeloyl-ACP methyl ester carboxylesterase